MIKLSPIFIFLLWSGVAQAQDSLPQFSGDGCPEGSVRVAFSPDYSTVSVLFDRFTVEAGGANAPKKNEKSCILQIPVEVPKGKSVSVSKIDYRGFVDLPKNAQGELSVRNAFKHKGGPGVSRRFRGEVRDEFLETSQDSPNEAYWSPCGGLEGISVVTTLALHSPKERALMSLDSQDAQGSRGFVYRLEWRDCSGKKDKGR